MRRPSLSPTMSRGLTLAALLIALAPAAASAQAISFKLAPRYSFATFKTDAPLETVVGHTADAGIDGALTVDPARPQAAAGTVKVDMNAVRTGVDKRDTDMRGKSYLDTDVEANRWVTFEVKSVEVGAPLESGKPVPARIRGLLTVKQKPVERVAEGTVTYIKLSPEQVEQQKRFGFTSDNIKVRTKLATSFTDHAMQVPQLLILKLSNDIAIETT
ncbi:MAG TPA: YceI family protein [Methylomirabilota bacterium]|nr:YceI family protein [Methylomirabilota bacterium]